jgi:peroxiredoxin
MSKQAKLPKALWIVIGLAAVTVVAVFATVGNQLIKPKDATDVSHEHITQPQKTWDEAFTSSFGTEAADFVVEDIEGRTHKLGDYHGRNVVVVFWATWCPACNLEIPHLIELRKMLAKDKLGILAISNEEPEHLKNFAASKNINYTIATLGGPLPEPFASVTSIPTTFFIDPEGKIKFAAVGVVSLEHAKAILNAEK